MSRKMDRDERFFYDHAGYSVAQGETKSQGKRRCAIALTQAERYASDSNWTYEWEFDEDGCIGCDCGSEDCACSTGEPHEVLCCILRDSSRNVLASLGSICDPTREYGRVIEAELALEAMHAVAEVSA